MPLRGAEVDMFVANEVGDISWDGSSVSAEVQMKSAA